MGVTGVEAELISGNASNIREASDSAQAQEPPVELEIPHSHAADLQTVPHVTELAARLAEASPETLAQIAALLRGKP